MHMAGGAGRSGRMSSGSFKASRIGERTLCPLCSPAVLRPRCGASAGTPAAAQPAASSQGASPAPAKPWPAAVLRWQQARRGLLAWHHPLLPLLACKQAHAACTGIPRALPTSPHNRAGPLFCQVEGCGMPLETLKEYHQRYKVGCTAGRTAERARAACGSWLNLDWLPTHGAASPCTMPTCHGHALIAAPVPSAA